MREQNWRNYIEERKNKIAMTTTLAQLIQQDDRNKNRYRQALDLLVQGEEEANNLIADINDALAEHAKEGERLKTEAAQLRAFRRPGSDPGPSNEAQGNGKGKGTAREQSDSPELDLEDEEGIPRTPAGDAHRTKGQSLQLRLREARIVLHKIKFLQGDVYHILGKSYEESENEAYASAEDLRRMLLKGVGGVEVLRARLSLLAQGRKRLRRRL